NAAIEQKWIKGISTGLLCNSPSGTTRKPVAVAFNEIFEAVVWVKLRFYLNFFKAGYYKRILNRIGADINRHGDRWILQVGADVRQFECDRRFGTARSIVHYNIVFKASFRAKFFSDHLFDKRDVMFFNPFIEKLGGYLDH